jgi:sec-independent protein translocase protein TatA
MYHSPLEIALVLLIVLVLFGPKRIPELARALGRGVRNFRGAVGGADDAPAERAGDDEVEQRRRALEQARARLAAAEAGAEKPIEGEVVTERKG